MPWMHEPVANSAPAAPDVFQLERNDPVSKKGQDRMNRPGKSQTEIRPPHRLGKGNSGNDFRDDSFKESP